MHYYGGFYQLVETYFHILTVGVSRPLHIALCVSLEWSMKYGLLPEEKQPEILPRFYSSFSDALPPCRFVTFHIRIPFSETVYLLFLTIL